MIDMPDCTVHRRVIERLGVVGPMADANIVLNRLYDAGFIVTRTGPYTDRKLRPRVDPTRFLYHAEREFELP